MNHQVYIKVYIYIYIHQLCYIYIYIPIHGYITNYGYHHVFGFPPRHIRIVLPIAIRHCQQHFLCNLRQNQNDVQDVPSAACPQQLMTTVSFPRKAMDFWLKLDL